MVEGAVIGSYQIVRKLGEGGMGAVYLGHHALLGRRAAIKVLLPALSARPDVVNRFFNEARAVTSISDPGIVQVFDFGYHTDGSAFIVMEFLDGEALDVRLHRLGRLSVVESLRLARQVATSLAAAHAQHIIHRDLKPENIFLVKDSEVSSGERSKILDFGIAKLADDHPGKIKTHTGAIIGTPVYMSPEQCRGLAELDHRSDIYALGCVLFHLLTGRPPFEGEGMGDIIAAHIRETAPAPSAILPSISPQVDALVLRCLAKSPDDRFQTITEVATAIGQLLPYLTAPDSVTHFVTPPPPVPPQPTPAIPTPTTLGSSNGQVNTAAPPVRRSRAPMIALAAIGVVGIAVVALMVVGHGSAPPVAHGAVAAPIDAAAAVVVAPSPDAAAPPADAAAVAVAPPPDAAVPVAVVAPVSAAHPHHATVVRHATPSLPSKGSAAPAPVDNCDHAIDTDCDGIPDKR